MVIEQNNFVQKILKAIREVIGDGTVSLHEPHFTGNEWAYLKECLDSSYVSSVGKFVDRFEAELTAFTGARHAIAVVNGTAALHIALKLAGVVTGDEVLIPALTFVATANAVSYCGATPHFVESEERSLGIDTDKLREYLADKTEIQDGNCINTTTGKVIRALVPVHVFGHPSDMDGLLAVTRDFNLTLVEDATESLGSTYHGRHTGTFGLMGTLSFNGNKTITTGGGGAIITNNPELAKRAKHLTTTAKLPHPWNLAHDEIGYNYRMPNLNAALGCAQIEQLPEYLKAKRDIYRRYQHAFRKIHGVYLFSEPAQCISNYWLQTLIIDQGMVDQREAILQAANNAGIMVRPAWDLINTLKPYQDCPTMDLTNTVTLQERILNIPSSANLTGNGH